MLRLWARLAALSMRLARHGALSTRRRCRAWYGRGKLALMARKQALLHQPPNPSIERTPSGMLRMPTVAAHVQR